MSAPAAVGRVLPTLNEDGSRRWLRPKPSPGRFWRRRRAVAYALMLVFFAIPHLRIAGKPVILLDLPRRQFTLFGATFQPTEMLLFMLLFVGTLVAIFLVTALAGRVWCGWGCPQTVYLEFVFRPIERWIEGGWRGSRKLDRRGGLHPRRLLKLLVTLALSMALAHVFLAYFVGVDELARWVRRSPVEHPTSFLVMAFTAGLVFLDFAWFREQTCLVACPYGRLQSVLLDRRSIVVAYDPGRGEPRMRGMPRPPGAGDCVNCELCVLTCPTGIDIRQGLQMECVHCTQCMDACDAVMARIGRPPGLIRYTSADALAGRPGGVLRPRVAIYAAALAVLLGAFVWALSLHGEPEVTLLRGMGEPYSVEPDGRVLNQIRVKIANRGRADRAYRLALSGAPDATLIAPLNPLPVPAGDARTTSVFVLAPLAGFADGLRPIAIHVSDGARFAADVPYRLIGPEAEREEPGEREHSREGESR